MKIPSVFYGKPGQVTLRVRKLAKKLVADRDFGDYDSGELLDTAEVAGLVLVDQEFEHSAASHFHCYLLPNLLSEASQQADIRPNLHDWLMASLSEEWRFVTTLGGSAWLGLDKRGHSFARRYVEAAIQHWPTIAGIENRFGPRLEGHPFVDQWRTLSMALEILGLSAHERMSIPAREPQVLLDLIDKRGVSS